MIATSTELYSFGEMLKAFRKRRRLTQQQLAEKIGVHRSAIVRWEQGDFLPQSKTLVLEVIKHLHLDEQESRHLLEASMTALSPHWYVPLPRNPFFTGREKIVEALHTQLGVEQAVALTQSSALQGLGGVGKSQIALEYTYRYALEYSAVFWIGAETEENIVSSLLSIAEVLQLPERDEKEQQRVVVAVQRWLTTHIQWLLVWDNMEDLTLLDRFLPSAHQGAILITTRCQALGTFARGVDLLPMEQEEGMLFLLRRAKVLSPEATSEQVSQLARRLPVQYTAAAELVDAMEGLPLALDQAGAYIEETGCSLSDYLQQYEQQRTCLLDRRGDLGRDHPQSVTATFRLAMEHVEREQTTAAELLHICAFLHAEAIPEELFVAGGAHLEPELARFSTDPAQFDRAIAALRRLSLVQRQPKAHTLSLHRLVQAVLRESMSEQEQAKWLKRVMALLNTALPEVTYQAWELCGRLLPHVLTVAAAIWDGAGDRELVEALRKAADYLRGCGRYEQAQPLYQRALRIGKQVWGPEHSQVTHILCGLGFLFYEQGRYQQAEPLFQSVLRIREQTLGPTHSDVAVPLRGLGLLCWKQGKYGQAERMFQRACSILEQALGREHPWVADLLNGLAILLMEQGKYQQAEPLHQRALSIRSHRLGRDHPHTAESLNNLADLYLEQERYKQAESLYRRALHLWRQALGPEHPNLAYPFHGLAILVASRGRYKQAESLYRQALHLWTQALGPEHPQVAHSFNNLATLYVEQGEYEQAELFFQRARCIREQHLGPYHPETAQTLHDLAVFWLKRGKRSEALSMAERALSIRSQSLGDSHTKTAATQTLYAQLLQEQASSQEEKASPSSLAENDPVQEFLDVCCELHPLAWCRISDLWQTYEQWTASCQGRVPLSRRAFAAQVKARGCQVDRTSTARIWRGISLKHKNL